MVVEGNTKVFGLNEIIQTISMNKHTGMIEIKCNDPDEKGREQHLYFQKGNLVFMAINGRPALEFSRLLPRIGIVPKEKIDKIIEDSSLPPGKASGKMGALLVERGVIPEKILRTIAYRFYESEMFEILSWEDADFWFHMDVKPEENFEVIDELARINTPAERMVMEVLRQIDEVDLLKQKIPDLSQFYRIRRDKKKEIQALKLNPVEKRVIQCLDGTQNLRYVLEEIFIGKFGLYQLIETLLEKDLAETLEKEELRDMADKMREMANTDQAIEMLRAAVKLDGEDVELRRELALLLRENDQFEEAARQFGIIGTTYLDRENYDSVVSNLKNAIRLDPGNTELQKKLFQTYLAVEDFPNAKKTAQTLYLIYQKEENFREIEEIYRTLVNLDPTDIHSKMILAEALANQEAKNIPQAAILYEEVANSFESQGKTKQANRIYRKIMEIQPNHPEARRRVGGSRVMQAVTKGEGGGQVWLILTILLLVVAAVVVLFLVI